MYKFGSRCSSEPIAMVATRTALRGRLHSDHLTLPCSFATSRLLSFTAARLRHKTEDGGEVVVIDEIPGREARCIVERGEDPVQFRVLDVIEGSNPGFGASLTSIFNDCGGGTCEVDTEEAKAERIEREVGEARFPQVKCGRQGQPILGVSVGAAEACHVRALLVGLQFLDVAAAAAHAPAAANLTVPATGHNGAAG
jgi:hypothetical protein